jgi:phenylalanyl-tRNA synthetase beta chain
VHPAVAERGVRRGLDLISRWSDGDVAQGLVDAYPLPPEDPTVMVTPVDVQRWLGISLQPEEIAEILRRLEFSVDVQGEQVFATVPDHRLDIGRGMIGVADLVEEIARINGYERIPETRLMDRLPPQRGNLSLEREERARDLLANLGLQEVITYRMTSPEREARLLSGPVEKFSAFAVGNLTLPGSRPYVRLANPIASDRSVMRQSLLSSVMETVERNARNRERLAMFEIGPVFLGSERNVLPDEPLRLAIALTGPREEPGWQDADTAPMDFYDLKGVVDTFLRELHAGEIRYEPYEYPAFHPGKSARFWFNGQPVGVIGAMHPSIHQRFEIPDTPLLAAEVDLETVLAGIPDRYPTQPVPAFPPVLEDLAVIVDEEVPAAQVEQLIRQEGGRTVTGVRLFDLYRGEQIGSGRKSLAYSLTYQDPERTLTDKEVAAVRQRIIRRLEEQLGARLRS